MLSMQDFPVDFVAVTTLKWGEGEKKRKMSENEKRFEINSVSTLFAWDCGKDKLSKTRRKTSFFMLMIFGGLGLLSYEWTIERYAFL